MTAVYQVFRSKVDPEDAQRLLEIRPVAMAAVRAACPELVRADLVRLDRDTWLDVLVWSDPAAPEAAGARLAGIEAVSNMHALVREIISVELGELAHSLP